MLRDFFTDYKTYKNQALLLGKGPTFRPPTENERESYLTIGLNHTIRETPVDLALIIDIEVINQLGEKLRGNALALAIPYWPHFGFKAGLMRLEAIASKHPIVSRMAKEGRVFGFNLSTHPVVVNKSPIVKAKHYSAEAAVNLLGHLGIKTIRTLGIDGGVEQSKAFDDLTNYNKERGYDLQWAGIRQAIQSFHLDYAPFGAESPIRVFVGAGEKQLIPALVLKHSILKHATMSCDVTIMNDWIHPMPKNKKNWPRTPFSFQRFMIPEKIQGDMGIYMDSDMLVFADVKEIWTEPTREGLLTMRNDDVDQYRAKFAVCRYDGAVYHPTIQEIVDGLDSGKWTYEDVVFDFKHEVMGIREGFNSYWNDLENYTEGKTKLLHYTFMGTQPWRCAKEHPLGYLWFNELREAVMGGSIHGFLVAEHVKKGWILSKCLEVLDDSRSTISSI
jgi:hypothetical protein